MNLHPKHTYSVFPFSSDKNNNNDELRTLTTTRRNTQATPISTTLLKRSTIPDSRHTLPSDLLRNQKPALPRSPIQTDRHNRIDPTTIVLLYRFFVLFLLFMWILT
ncbi:unnamed protein product [Vicia faba]|uniref:Uncharacterized protein n=1 Tax=Vicia faba TaxID=3906 RepID=A0AAV0Z9L3_VICFA|nr:unnamed protein product [Vicia faba]